MGLGRCAGADARAFLEVESAPYLPTHSSLQVRRVELTGLSPDTLHEFVLAEKPGPEAKGVRRFRTLPATLNRPLRRHDAHPGICRYDEQTGRRTGAGIFALPENRSYYALDCGDYASFLVLDTNHTHPIPGDQTVWLAGAMASRD